MEPAAVILFDGVCNFCSNVVQFVIERDREQYFSFAPLQSDIARRLTAPHQVDASALRSFILIENGKLYSRSTAALRVCRQLSGAWPVLMVLLLVPAFIRNAVYDWIARNRYRWFGKKDACMIPSAEVRARFLQ